MKNLSIRSLIVPVIFVAIIILAFFLRSEMFLHHDFLYLSDQSRDLLLAKSIVVDHKLTLIGGRTGFGGLFHGALWIYMITPFFLLAHGDPFNTLVPLFELVNLGIVVVGFFVGWRLYGKWVGLLIALFLATSKVLIDPTPVTSNAEMLPIVFLLYLYSIIKFMRGQDKYFILSLFFVGLGFQFESAFAVLLIPLTIVAVGLRRKMPKVRDLALGIVGFFLAVSTFILFDLRHNFLMTSSALKLFTNTQKPLPGYEQYAHITYRVQDRVINLWQSMFSPLNSNNALAQVLLLVIVSLGIIFLFKKIFKEKKIGISEKEYIFIIISPLLIFGIYILYPLPLWPHYLLPVSVVAVLILVLSIKTVWENTVAKFIVAIFLILVILISLFGLKNSYIDHEEYKAVSDGSYINQLSVAEWAISDSKDKSAGYFVYTPGILTYSMDYLFWWIGKRDHIPTPTNVKAPATYLIMYNGLSGDQSAHTFWKKNIIKTNAMPKLTKSFPGGLLIEVVDLSKDKEQVDPNYFQNLIFR